ncbi:MAG TPA: hypothetical protein VGL93_10455 [Streptosporangiaceae bacterium]|jgi:hypothetical protein
MNTDRGGSRTNSGRRSVGGRAEVMLGDLRDVLDGEAKRLGVDRAALVRALCADGLRRRRVIDKRTADAYALNQASTRYGTRSVGDASRSAARAMQRLGAAFDATPADALIISAYHEAAAEPGDFVSLTAIRDALVGFPREEVDAALDNLYRHQIINLIPRSNQRALTDAARAAAVHIGDEDKHLISIEPE